MSFKTRETHTLFGRMTDKSHFGKKSREIHRDKEVFFEAETIHQWKNRIVWKNLLILLQKAFFSRLEKIDASPEAFCLINRELMRIEIYGTIVTMD